MADLYRKSSLERISSPDQIDKTLKITSPMSWIALLGVTLIIVVTIIWSIVGTIPETVTTNGMIVSAVSTNSIYTEESGIITSIYVSSGDEIHFGDPVMDIQNKRGETVTVTSDQVGTISEVLYTTGGSVTQNTEIARVSPVINGNTKQAVVCYVPLSEAKKIERGMTTYIYLSSADSQTYGHMEGRVINIDSKATSAASMSSVLGSDNNLSSSFLNNGAVVSVTCEIYIEKNSQGHKNEYFWSNDKGYTLEVSNGSPCSAKIITDEVSPISKLFKKIKEIWGGKK